MSTTYTVDDLAWLTPLCQDIFILPEAEQDEHLSAAGLDPELIVALRRRVAELDAAKQHKDKDALEDEDDDSHESTTALAADVPPHDSSSSSSVTAAPAPLVRSYSRSPGFERNYVRRRTTSIALLLSPTRPVSGHHHNPFSTPTGERDRGDRDRDRDRDHSDYHHSSRNDYPPHHRRPFSPTEDPKRHSRPFLTFRPDWPGTGDVYDIADYLSGDHLSGRSTWNVPAAIERVHDAHARLTTRTYSVPTTTREFGTTLARDIRRSRLPVIHPLTGRAGIVPHDPKTKRKVLNAVETLSWMYGREMGAGHLRAVQLGSAPFAEYVGERAKGVACANIMDALGRRGLGGGPAGCSGRGGGGGGGRGADAGALGGGGSSSGGGVCRGGGSGDSRLGGGSVKTPSNLSRSAKVGTRIAKRLCEDGDDSGGGSGHSGSAPGEGGGGGSGSDSHRDDGHKSTPRDDDDGRGEGPTKRPRMSE